MTATKQPEALRLADELEREKWHVPAVVMQAAAEELRRQHAELAARAPADSVTAPAGDPLDWPLPCDITAGGVTIGKGCPLRTVQTRLEVQAEANRLLVKRMGLELASATPPAQAADSVLEDATFEAVRKNLCALQRYSFCLDDDGVVRRVQDRTGNWIEFDDAHKLFDPVAMDAARKQGANHD